MGGQAGSGSRQRLAKTPSGLVHISIAIPAWLPTVPAELARARDEQRADDFKTIEVRSDWMWVGVSHELTDGRFLGSRCRFYLVSHPSKNPVGLGDVGKAWSLEALEPLLFTYKAVAMVESTLVSGGCETGSIKTQEGVAAGVGVL